MTSTTEVTPGTTTGTAIGTATGVSTGTTAASTNESAAGSSSGSVSGSSTVRKAVVTVDGARIPYRVVGRGPVLVLIHGTGPGSIMWDDLIERYAQRHTLLLPDLSGSVPAEDDGAPLTVERFAAQVAAVIEDVGRGLADVLGFSMGATVALGLAALRPDLVRHVIAVAGWPDAEDEYLRNLLTVWTRLAPDPEAFGRFAMMTAFSPAFLNAIGHEAAEASATFMQPLPGTLRHIAYDGTLDLKPLLPRITAPTLVVGCTQDATIPVANARRLHALIPHSEYREFDSGHIVLAECGDEFERTVLEFLATA